MCLMVSSDVPSKLLRMPSASLEKRANSGQTSSTWSRKQWPVPSSSIVSCFSSSALIDLRLASGCAFGTATMKGSSYSGAIARPVSGKGSAMIAQSSSPVRSISSSLTVKFSCSISGICGLMLDRLPHQLGQQVGPDGVDDAQAQRPGQRVLAALGDLLDRRGLLDHRLRLAHDRLAQRRDADLVAAALEELERRVPPRAS